MFSRVKPGNCRHLSQGFLELSIFFFFHVTLPPLIGRTSRIEFIIPSQTRRMSIFVNAISQKGCHMADECSNGALKKFRAVSMIALLTTLMQPNPLFVESFTLPVGKNQFFTPKTHSAQYSFARSM